MRYESEMHTYLMVSSKIIGFANKSHGLCVNADFMLYSHLQSLDEEKRNKVLRKTKISLPTKRKVRGLFIASKWKISLIWKGVWTSCFALYYK